MEIEKFSRINMTKANIFCSRNCECKHISHCTTSGCAKKMSVCQKCSSSLTSHGEL